MALNPQPTPKMGEYKDCISCGRCVFGCSQGAKWDSRRFLQVAIDHGAALATGCNVERVVMEAGKATGGGACKGWLRCFYPADLVSHPTASLAGQSPILTIIALAKQVSQACMDLWQ